MFKWVPLVIAELLTMSVILFVCPLNIRTTLLISISITWISKSSKETANKELYKEREQE